MLARWNPPTTGTAASALSAWSAFDNLFRNFGFSDFALFRDLPTGPVTWPTTVTPPADITETEDTLHVMVDLPGCTSEAIQVELQGDTLIIKAERKAESQVTGLNHLRTERYYGAYSRSFVLPDMVDGSKPEARYINGVLNISLPKRADAKSKLIPVKAS